MTLEEQYKKETGQDAICITTDGIHCVGFEVYRFDYVKWLEEKASRDSRMLSAVPSDELSEIINQLSRLQHYLSSGETYCFDNEHDERDAEKLGIFIDKLITKRGIAG